MIIIPGTSLPALSNPGAAGDLKNGKQLIDANGNVLTGTMPTITLPTPGITVSSGGLITASYEADAGYTSGGSKSGTKQLTTQAGTTITPGSSQKTAVASGRYTTGMVYVAGDSDLKAENIKSGVNIFGVTGTLTTGYDIEIRVTNEIEGYDSRDGYREFRVYYDGTIPTYPSSGNWEFVSYMLKGYFQYGGTVILGGAAFDSMSNTIIFHDGIETQVQGCMLGDITSSYYVLKLPLTVWYDYGEIESIDSMVSHVVFANGAIWP